MAVAWNVPPNGESEGRGRNVPHWQFNGGVAGGGLQRQISGVQTPSLSLSLSTSGEDLAPLWQRRRTHFGLEATGAKNTQALVAQRCLVLLIQYR